MIYASYATADGAPAYDPRMMLKLLLYSYSIGVTSSREMERRCVTDVAFRFLSANATPDYRSIRVFAAATSPLSTTCSPRCSCCAQQPGSCEL